MVPDKERGIGLWLKRQREKEGYPSQRLLLDALARHGIKIHASAYATLESHGVADTPGKRKTVETIAAFYGVPPPDMSAGSAGEGMAELIASNLAVAKQLSELVKRLDSLGSQAIRDGVTDALRQAGLLPNGGGSQSAPPPSPQP